MPRKTFKARVSHSIYGQIITKTNKSSLTFSLQSQTFQCIDMTSHLQLDGINLTQMTVLPPQLNIIVSISCLNQFLSLVTLFFI